MNKPINFFIIVMLVSVSGILLIQQSPAEGKTATLTTTPTDLVATPVSPSQIDLSWNAPTQNYGKVIVGYKIEERLSSGVYNPLDNTASTLTAYSVTGLKTGTAHTYRVSAVYSDDTTTDPSNPASATPTLTSAPTQPTPPSSEQTSNVKFDFTPSDGTGLVGVILTQGDYVQLLYQKDTRSVISNIASTSQAPNNNVKTVLAYQNAHLSYDTVPGPLIATTFAPTQINLWWVPPAQNYGKLIIGYQIEWKRAPGDYIVIDDNTQNTTTRYSVYPLTPGNTYTYRVSAIYNDHTRSNPSNEASATTILTQQQTAQNQQATTNASSASSSSKQQTSTSTTQVINVKFDFTPVDGKILIGVVLSQSDYQQLLVIKDPRSIVSNIMQTTDTANNSLAGLIKYQGLHTPQTVPETPAYNNTPAPLPIQTSGIPINNLIYNVITSVIAIGAVGIITWFVRTKIAKRIAKEYIFTMEKYAENGIVHMRIRNSGPTIEYCTILSDKETCVWIDTNLDKPRHILEGSISAVRLPVGAENGNHLISLKAGKKVLRKIKLGKMAHG